VPEAAASCLCPDGDHLTLGSGGDFIFTHAILIIIQLLLKFAPLAGAALTTIGRHAEKGMAASHASNSGARSQHCMHC
jgi:hypothetical protein